MLKLYNLHSLTAQHFQYSGYSVPSNKCVSYMSSCSNSIFFCISVNNCSTSIFHAIFEIIVSLSYMLVKRKCSSNTSCFNMTYLMINAAATFLTLGHFSNATTVSKLPNNPITMMKPVTTAANVRRPGENLQ